MKNFKTPFAVLITILLQSLTAVWWLAKLDLKVEIHDQFMKKNEEMIGVIYKLEERIKSISEDLEEFKNHVYKKHLQ